MHVGNSRKELIVAAHARNDAGESKHIPRRVIGVDRHVDTGLVTSRHNAVEEVNEIFKELLVAHTAVSVQERVELLGGIAFIPTGKVEVVRIQAHQLLVVVGECVGTILCLGMQISAQPVEYRHKVVANALNACLAKVANGGCIVCNVTVTGRQTELDVLVYGNALDNLHLKTFFVAERFEAQDLIHLPNLTHGNVINSGNNAAHSGDLTDIRKRNAILFSVPTKCHFHGSFVLSVF